VIHYRHWKILRHVCLLEVVTNQYQHSVDVCRAQLLRTVTARCIVDFLQCRPADPKADPKAPHHITSIELFAGYYKPGYIHVEYAVRVCGVSTRRLFGLCRPASHVERAERYRSAAHSEGAIKERGPGMCAAGNNNLINVSYRMIVVSSLPSHVLRWV
jgi:hypothetical protein